MSHSSKTRWVALRIAGYYVLFGSLWIVVSGWLLHRFVTNPATEVMLETVKGWAFVFVTGLLLASLLNRNLREIGRWADSLKESENRWNFALDAAGYGVWDWNIQTNQVYYSPQWKALLGYSPEEIEPLFEEWESRIHSQDLASAVEALRQHLAGRSANFRSEHRLRCKDGSHKWILSRGRVTQRSAEGKPLRMVGTDSDISELKAAEAALREGLLFRREAEKIARIGAWKVNPKTNYLYWTEGVHDVIGIPFDYKPGFEEGLKFYDPESIPELRRALEKAVQDGAPFVIELGLNTATGQHIWTEVRGLGRIEEGGDAFAMGTFQDVTERKSVLEQLVQAQKMESVGRLAGGVAHDFNNLLTVILGYGRLLLAKLPQGNPSREPIAAICSAGERAAALTQQLLAFSRRQAMQPRILNLNDVLQATSRLLQRLIGEDIVLEVVPDPHLWNIRADAVQMDQVLMNLAVNARDAMPNGGRLCLETANRIVDAATAARYADAVTGPQVRLTVRDTGTGMDEATLSHLFEPFFTTKPQGAGTGLGLATVYGIVKQSGGWICVESEPGNGSAFHIYLPIVTEQKGEAEPGPSSDAAPPVGGATILLVEDQDAVRSLCSAVLRNSGYRVLEAENGEHALQLLATESDQIDLILTDVVMPGLSGNELAARANRQHAALPVLYMTGYADREFAPDSPGTPAAQLLRKPFTPSELLNRVRESLRDHRPESA
jgi:PAS domain S-box-containing protein